MRSTALETASNMKLASAYNPESNGLAESAVKNMKSLISRCIQGKENIPMAIMVWSNMARDNGQSPSRLFFGRIQRQRLPMLTTQTTNELKCFNAKDALSKASTDSRNSNAKDYSRLAIGSLALMQCHLSKKWEKEVRIVAPREDGTSYIVEGVSSGKQYHRGRRLLKPHPNPHFLEMENSVQ